MVYLICKEPKYYQGIEIIGFFDNRLDADKYCALHADENLYIYESPSLALKENLSDVKLKYLFCVEFKLDLCGWCLIPRTSYEPYLAEENKKNHITYCDYLNYFIFDINLEENDPAKAEKIAQEYFNQIIGVSMENKELIKKLVDNLNEQFMREPLYSVELDWKE